MLTPDSQTGGGVGGEGSGIGPDLLAKETNIAPGVQDHQSNGGLSCSVTLQKKELEPILFWAWSILVGRPPKKLETELEPLNN